MFRPNILLNARQTSMISPTNRAFHPLEQMRKILRLAPVADAIVAVHEFLVETPLYDSGPIHGVAVSGAAGVDADSAVEAVAGCAP